MPSPFPGMNPYLERSGVSSMFHSQFISSCQQHLARQLRPRYVVMMETHVYIHEPSAAERLSGKSAWVEIEKSRFLELWDRNSNRLVTVIELLSPANKYAGPDRDQYVAKRSQVLVSRTHLVEIDLLRGGPRMPVTGLPKCDGFALVSRVDERPKVGLWTWTLREALPELPIPVAEGEPDAVLPLKATLEEVVDAGSYEDFLYLAPPEPRMNAEDLAWAEELRAGAAKS